MNPASEQIGKNILCSNDRNFVFLRKGFQKITMLNAELAQASPTAKVDKSLFMMHIKINGKIVQMMNLYNRLAVITSSGVLWILNQNLWDKKQILTGKKEVDLQINSLDEFVTCASLSFDCEYLTVCTKVIFEGGNACNRVRLFKVVSADNYRLISK